MPDVAAKPNKLDEGDIRAFKLLAERERTHSAQVSRFEHAEGLVRTKLHLGSGDPIPSGVRAEYGLQVELDRLETLEVALAADETAALAALKTKYELADGDTYDLTTGLITRS